MVRNNEITLGITIRQKCNLIVYICRKFIEAAQRYNELSYRNIIHEDERMTCLRNALICTVLASAGMNSFVIVISIKDRSLY